MEWSPSSFHAMPFSKRVHTQVLAECSRAGPERRPASFYHPELCHEQVCVFVFSKASCVEVCVSFSELVHCVRMYAYCGGREEGGGGHVLHVHRRIHVLV